MPNNEVSKITVGESTYNIKDSVSRDGLENKADKSQLLYKNDTVISTNNAPYLQRQALTVEGASPYVKENLVGGTVAVNQFCDPTVSVTGLAGQNLDLVFTTFNGIAGHKYFLSINQNIDLTSVGRNMLVFKLSNNTYQYTNPGQTLTKGTRSIIVSLNLSGSTIFYMWSNNPSDDVIYSRPQLIDLTQMLGTTIADYVYSLETATAGAGVAKLKEWGFLTKDYYPYNAGALQSVKTSGKKVVGKNLFKNYGTSTSYSGVTAVVNDDGTVSFSGTPTAYFYIELNQVHFEPKRYLLNGLAGTSNLRYEINVLDSNNQDVVSPWSATDTGDIELDLRNLIFDKVRISIARNANNVAVSGTVKPMIRFADIEDSTYEPYSSTTYPTSPIDLRGIFKLDANNNLYADGDVYSADGMVTRNYQLRAYASGDESLADAITDGTNTVVKLATPTTETTTPFTSPQSLDGVTLEEYLDTRDFPVPVGHETQYMGASEKLVQMPSTPLDGEYVMKNTVSGGKGQMVWENDDITRFSFVPNDNSTFNNLIAKVQRDFVIINGYISNITLTADTAKTIGTISNSSYYPKDLIRMPVALSDQPYNPPSTIGYMSFNTNGDIYMLSKSSGTFVAYFNVCYFIK